MRSDARRLTTAVEAKPSRIGNARSASTPVRGRPSAQGARRCSSSTASGRSPERLAGVRWPHQIPARRRRREMRPIHFTHLELIAGFEGLPGPTLAGEEARALALEEAGPSLPLTRQSRCRRRRAGVGGRLYRSAAARMANASAALEMCPLIGAVDVPALRCRCHKLFNPYPCHNSPPLTCRRDVTGTGKYAADRGLHSGQHPKAGRVWARP
jgi:hypothetical protein